MSTENDAANGGPDWPKIQAEFEHGGPSNSLRQLGKRHSVAHMAIARRAKREGWSQSVERSIANKAAELVAGVSSTDATPKKAAAVTAEATRRADVIRRHRDEWNGARGRVYAGLTAHQVAEAGAAGDADRRRAFDVLKAAKISSEALSIIQANERRAWNIAADAEPTPLGARRVIVVFGDPYAEDPAEQSETAPVG